MDVPARLSSAEARYELERRKKEQEAREELERREKARSSSLAFAQYVDPTYTENAFYQDLNAKLDLVLSGEIKRLMIFAPPQHGKSRTISETFPARWIGENPDIPCAIVSYGAFLAQNFSTRVRDIVEGSEFPKLYGELSNRGQRLTTRDDMRAKGMWRLSYPFRGGLWAGGVGGPIGGIGFGLIIIDDPYKSWKDAHSDTVREAVYQYYRGTMMTRLWQDGRVIIVTTRWHENDLPGRLLSEEPDEWAVVRYPALAESQKVRDTNNEFIGLPIGEPDPLGREEGEPLSPERFNKEGLEEKESDVGPRAWAAEYQGVPRPAEGDMIKRHWFEFVSRVPKEAKRVRYWDKAGSEGAGAFTAGVLVAEHEQTFYIEDVVRGQWSSNEREKIIHQTIVRDTQMYGNKVITYIEQEPGSGGKESAEYTIKNNAGYRIKKDLPSGDKDTRLQPFADQAEGGNVKILTALWNNIWLNELTAIPNSTYRDQGDATAGAFNKLAIKKAGGKPFKSRGLYASRDRDRKR